MKTGKYKRTKETKQKIGEANRKRIISVETRKKLSEICKKIKSWKRFPDNINENHGMWKGDKVGYRALHNWIIGKKGKASEYQCKHCDKQARHWANINHKYKRKLKDYIALCMKCHKQYDKKNILEYQAEKKIYINH